MQGDKTSYRNISRSNPPDMGSELHYGFEIWHPAMGYQRPLTRKEKWEIYDIPVLILSLCPANGRRRYFVTTSPTGWAQAKKHFRDTTKKIYQ